jgi:hypothetical protein
MLEIRYVAYEHKVTIDQVNSNSALHEEHPGFESRTKHRILAEVVRGFLHSWES